MATPQIGGSWLARLLRDELIKKAFWYGLAGAVGLAAVVYARNSEGLNVVAVLGYVFAILIAAAWAASSVYTRKSYARPYYPRLKFPYDLISKTVTYEIRGDGLLHFSRRVRLRSLVDNVNSYVDKFVWTGGECELPMPGDGCIETSQMYQAGIWTYYSTQLSRSLRRGEEHEFVIEWAPLNNWRNSRPFVSTSTEEPCRELNFDIHVPENALHNSDVYVEEMRGIEATHAFSTNLRSFAHGQFTWSVRPKLYRHYRVRWSWSGEGEVQAIPENEAGA